MVKTRWLSLLLQIAAILTLAACAGRVVEGSGDLVTETRQVSDFDSISLSGSGEVIVIQGDGEFLTVETDDNVMQHIRAEVRGRTLQLGFEEGVRFISPTRLIFRVGVDDLVGLTVSGSGDIESDTISTDRLEATISGSGNIQIADLTANDLQVEISGSGEFDLAGAAADQDLTISGSGKYLAGDLCGASVSVSVSGSGDATVCAMETLDADVSGSGSVNYYGRPLVNSSTSGSGRINSLGER